jgi:hypothetical protein
MGIEWTSVDVALPPHTGIVAVVVSDGATTVWCKALYVANDCFQAICQEIDGEITHWAAVELP